jgi:hypothetical protein
MDFFLWIIFLIIPAYIAIFMGANVSTSGSQFAVYVGKYANTCDDEISFKKVREK